MPTYEYECDDCHFCFDRKQRFSEEPVAACPKCQGKACRVIHSTPVIFRGSGFYVTDSRGVSDSKKAGEGPPDKKTKKGKQGKQG